jgi:hypothetical protein
MYIHPTFYTPIYPVLYLSYTRAQASIEADIASLRELVQRTRGLYASRAAKGVGPGWEKDVEVRQGSGFGVVNPTP